MPEAPYVLAKLSGIFSFYAEALDSSYYEIPCLSSDENRHGVLRTLK